MDWFPLTLSLKVAVLATLFSLAFALWAAWSLANRQFRGKELLDAVISLPLVLPPTVLGYYLLVVLGRESWFGTAYEKIVGQPLVFTWQAAVVAAFFHSAPLLVKYVRAALEGVDATYIRAARSLGISEWRIFWKVTFPLCSRPILAATALAFARSLGDFGVTIMLAGNIPGQTQTVSTAIYQAVEAGNGDLARNLVVIVSLLALLILWLANRLSPSQPLHS